MILRAAWVLPIAGPPIRDGVVQVAGARIARVGPFPPGGEWGPDELHDLGPAILTPGLVNAHTHLELTCYTGKIPPTDFWSWLPHLIQMRAAAGQLERESAGVREGAWQSLRAGVTCVGDISRRNVHWRVLRDIPIRKVCFVELLSLADQPPRNPQELAAAVAEVEEDELLTVGVTPHAPYSVPLAEIQSAIQLAARLQRPWTMHLAETLAERQFLGGDAGGLPRSIQRLLVQCRVDSPHCGPVDLLERCCAGAPPGLLAHFNYIDSDDAERLARSGHTVAYCPRAHRFFGHTPHPFRQLHDAGVRVVIATDSAASNDNVHLLEELRFLRSHVPSPPPPDVLLHMVTDWPAQALGLGERIGTLEPGQEADLAAWPSPAELDDPAGWLVDRAPTPQAVWVRGRGVI